MQKHRILNVGDRVTYIDVKDSVILDLLEYNVVRDNFERKLKRIYNKYFEKNEEKEIDEATACGASSGAFVAPMAPVIRKNIAEGCKVKKGRKIYITEKQFEELKESLTTFNAGNYQYTAPFPVDKNDPSMIHRKKGGISMDRLK